MPKLLCTGGHGSLVRITIHTLPNGLEQVNGSQGDLSCGVVLFQKQCILLSSTDNEDNELSNGEFPEPGDMSDSNWAQGFFTVNRGSSTTIEIGFRLESSVVIGEVQLSLLNCPARGIGAPNITLYGLMQPNMQPYTIPEFDINMATQVGSITVPENISCPVQIQSIPNSLEDPQDFQDYFLVFNYETNSTLSWVFLNEVQFFEQPPPPRTIHHGSSTTLDRRPDLPSTLVPQRTPKPKPGRTEDGGDLGFSTITAIVGVAVASLLCTSVLIIFCCICCIVRKRMRKRDETVGKRAVQLDNDYDIVYLQGGSSGEEIVNHMYESIGGARHNR